LHITWNGSSREVILILKKVTRHCLVSDNFAFRSKTWNCICKRIGINTYFISGFVLRQTHDFVQVHKIKM